MGNGLFPTRIASFPVGIASDSIGIALIPSRIGVILIGIVVNPMGIALILIGIVLIPTGIALIPMGIDAIPTRIAISPSRSAYSLSLFAQYLSAVSLQRFGVHVERGAGGLFPGELGGAAEAGFGEGAAGRFFVDEFEEGAC